jgi:hypothetical protein
MLDALAAHLAAFLAVEVDHRVDPLGAGRAADSMRTEDQA